MSTEKGPVARKAALYIRVSTDAQFEEGYSVEAQREMLEAYCVSKGIKVYETYIDGGFSGSNIARPAMERLIEDVKRGVISHVIVYKLDRLSRSQKDTMYLIEDVFLPRGVDFVSLNESFDTSTPFGRAMVGILSVFAQLERDNIRMRTRMGMRERVKSGLWPGGGKVPFGYDYDQTTGMLVKNSDADAVEKMYSLYLQGYSAGKIAKLMGFSHDRIVTQILRRSINAGYITYGGEKFKGLHEPIVSEQTYERTLSEMERRSVVRSHESPYLLRGLLVCGECGARMRYQRWGQAGMKLVCYSHDASKTHLSHGYCPSRPVSADEVERAVIEDIFRMAVSDDTQGMERVHSPQDVLKMRLSRASTALKRLYSLYADGGDELLLSEIEERRRELAQLEKAAADGEERSLREREMLERKRELRTVRELWPHMTDMERQALIRSCVEKVVVLPDGIDVYYRI